MKSVTLVREEKALFPDAPTQRGTRQLRALMRAKGEGYGAAILFLIQREDVTSLLPNKDIDLGFASALGQASQIGVDVFAYSCKVSPNEIGLAKEVVVCL